MNRKELELLLSRKPYLSLYFSENASSRNASERGSQTESAPQEAFRQEAFQETFQETSLASELPEYDAGREKIACQKNSDHRHFSIETAADGTLAVSCRYGSEKISLSSRYHPRREAKRLLEAALSAKWGRAAKEGDLKEGKEGKEIIVVLGLGAPALFDLLLDLLDRDQLCIAVDAHFELGQLLCNSSPDLQAWLLRPGCHLFCGEMMRPLLRQYLESLPAEGFSGLWVIDHPASLRLAPIFYREIEHEIGSLLKARISDLLTRMKFESLWLKNIILNCRHLPPAEHPKAALYSVRGYENILAGRPGVLVAAGPSLTESLDHISLLQERAFILAVDTSLLVLLQADIRPHAVISLDAQPQTLFSLLGCDLSDLLLFADLVAQPALLRKSEPSRLIFSTTGKLAVSAAGEADWQFTPGTDYAQAIHGRVGHLQSGGSVATSGFDLLRFLGCNPLILIGQDLAYTDRLIHARGAHHYSRWLTALSRSRSLPGIVENIVGLRNTFPTEAISGGSILTDHVLNIYHQWFEEALPRCQQQVVNLTSRGALLKNAVYPHPPHNPLDFIRSLPKMATLPQSLSNAPAPARFHHPQEEILHSAIIDTIQGRRSSSSLIESYPFMQPAAAQAELYIKRNFSRIDSSRRRLLLREKSAEALRMIERSLRHS